MTNASRSHRGLSRREFIALSGSAAAAVAMGGKSAFAQSAPLKFWDMPWGAPAYNNGAKTLVESSKPAAGLPTASYQTIQWANFFQTFASALASNTGPAVSTGGAFQVFQFADQGQIAYADNVIEGFKKSGFYDDFLPGTIEALKTPAGYVAVPWQIDMRIVWYRKSILEKAGTQPPTDWKSWLETGKALKKIGAFGFATASGASDNIGQQALIALMINNGGGLFDEHGKPDALFDRNVEAMEFVREMASEGLIDPASIAYTSDNLNTMWSSGRGAIGYNTPGLDQNLGDTSGEYQVLSPPTGPHGDKGTLSYINNIMMYKESPSQAGSEAFLTWYVQNLHSLWQKGIVPQLPVLKSIAATPEFQASTSFAKIIKEWQPVGKPYSARSPYSFSQLATVDSGPVLNDFAQTILGGKTDAKTALQALQKTLESAML
jgi:multiple sugar transport system substrate-binding protein